MDYAIDNDNGFAVRVFDGADTPIIFQPDYPNGDAFGSHEEAESWAKLAIEARLNPDAPFAPNGRGLVGEPKPQQIIDPLSNDQVAAQLALADANRKMLDLGFTQDDINALLNAAKN